MRARQEIEEMIAALEEVKETVGTLYKKKLVGAAELAGTFTECLVYANALRWVLDDKSTVLEEDLDVYSNNIKRIEAAEGRQ